MKTAEEIFDIDLKHWIPGTRFFSTNDEKFFVIDADTADYSNFSFKVIRRHTQVLYCNEDATVTDLVPDHTFPPGTTPEEAIQQLGYELI